MEVKVKKLDPNAVIPVKAHVSDAGFDLVATSLRWDEHEQFFEYGTGIAMDIPEGHVGLLFPRSSVSKKDLTLANSVGVVDAKFLGEIKLRFKHAVKEHEGQVTTSYFDGYMVGDRIGQLIIMPIPEVSFVETEKLGDSKRGEGGFGSSGE